MASNIILFPKEKYSPEEITEFQRQAYAWAANEQKHFCPKAHKGQMKRMDDAASKYGLHESFFSDPDNPDDVVYYRMWWNGSHDLSYAIITNGRQLSENNPELFSQMIRNGIYAFLRENSPAVCKALYGGGED